jgi:4-aminobutyrate aminotransferase-like enzyme
MIKNEINTSEYNKQFSVKLLEQRKFNKIQFPIKDVGHLTCTGNGHGPFAEFNDGSVKYDFSNLYNQTLLGYSHPLLIKLETETLLKFEKRDLPAEKLASLKVIPAFNQLINAHKITILNPYTVELFHEGFFGENERIEVITKQLTMELSRLKKNNLISSFECHNLCFSIAIKNNVNDVLTKQLNLGLVGMKGEHNKIQYLPPITLTSLHIKEVFTIIEKSLE